MANYTLAQTARAAAILTTGEVAASAYNCENSDYGALTVDLDFTIGNLTNVTVRFYGSADGTNYYAVADDATGVSEVLTATTHKLYRFSSNPGMKFFRVSLQGSGTATSSTATIVYRATRRGSQR